MEYVHVFAIQSFNQFQDPSIKLKHNMADILPNDRLWTH